MGGTVHRKLMTISATVHNHTITLPPEVIVAEGAEVQVVVPDFVSPLAWLEKFAGCIKDLPEDFAERHDHYIHGRKRRL